MTWNTVANEYFLAGLSRGLSGCAAAVDVGVRRLLLTPRRGNSPLRERQVTAGLASGLVFFRELTVRDWLRRAGGCSLQLGLLGESLDVRFVKVWGWWDWVGLGVEMGRVEFLGVGNAGLRC